jgi:hypothetical protein
MFYPYINEHQKKRAKISPLFFFRAVYIPCFFRRGVNISPLASRLSISPAELLHEYRSWKNWSLCVKIKEKTRFLLRSCLFLIYAVVRAKLSFPTIGCAKVFLTTTYKNTPANQLNSLSYPNSLPKKLLCHHKLCKLHKTCRDLCESPRNPIL